MGLLHFSGCLLHLLTGNTTPLNILKGKGKGNGRQKITTNHTKHSTPGTNVYDSTIDNKLIEMFPVLLQILETSNGSSQNVIYT